MLACNLVTPTENPGQISEPAKEEEKDTPKHVVISQMEEENIRSDWTDIDHGQIRKDVRNFREHFKRKKFLMNLSFGLVPSAWDIGTDFIFARKLAEDTNPAYATLSLIFIALPGLVYVATLIQSVLEKCTKHCYCPKVLKKVFSNICSLVFVGTIVVSLLVLQYGNWLDDATRLLICIILAVITATSILAIKTLGVFVHTENVNKLAVKTTSYEGSYESSLQLFLIMMVWLRDDKDFNLLDKMAMASSLVMIAKSGAENFLTFGAENKLSEERSMLSMLGILAKFSPVFLLTGFFRVGTLALFASWDHALMPLVLLPLAHTLPLVAVLMLKWCCGQLDHLSLTELVQGLVGELSSIVLWGKTGREGSRKIQLWIGGYLLLLYTATLGIMASDFKNESGQQLPQELLVFLLFSGWIGYGLFIYQVFLFDKYNVDCRKKVHIMGSSLAGH